MPVVPEHIVPLVEFLAKQEASGGVTGRCFDTMTWNLEHGLGGAGEWADLQAEAGIEAAVRARAGATS